MHDERPTPRTTGWRRARPAQSWLTLAWIVAGSAAIGFLVRELIERGLL